ncbi:hypothetical protein CLAIMM_12117 [Cladophialophora immunda]|nr:hypothetical protein CLAIMM_12117 [Cladophialophora immunda]
MKFVKVLDNSNSLLNFNYSIKKGGSPREGDTNSGAADVQKPEFLGYVFDPSTNKDIVLNEIEGRLLECNILPWPLQKAQAGAARPRENKITIMIDDEARRGGRPDYFKKQQRAFNVGFSTLLPKPDTPSPMTMQLIWRDNTEPVWGQIRDPHGVLCTLLPMYFCVRDNFVAGLTMDRPQYKFPDSLVWGATPSSMMAQQAPVALMAEQVPSAEIAMEDTVPDASSEGPANGTVAGDVVTPAEGMTTAGGGATAGDSQPNGDAAANENTTGDNDTPADNDTADPETLGEATVERVEEEMDEAAEGDADTGKLAEIGDDGLKWE